MFSSKTSSQKQCGQAEVSFKHLEKSLSEANDLFPDNAMEMKLYRVGKTVASCSQKRKLHIPLISTVEVCVV